MSAAVCCDDATGEKYSFILFDCDGREWTERVRVLRAGELCSDSSLVSCVMFVIGDGAAPELDIDGLEILPDLTELLTSFSCSGLGRRPPGVEGMVPAVRQPALWQAAL